MVSIALFQQMPDTLILVSCHCDLITYCLEWLAYIYTYTKTWYSTKYSKNKIECVRLYIFPDNENVIIEERPYQRDYDIEETKPRVNQSIKAFGGSRVEHCWEGFSWGKRKPFNANLIKNQSYHPANYIFKTYSSQFLKHDSH